MICPRCGLEVDKLTRDHILPKWFRNRIHHAGAEFPKYKGEVIQLICRPCNAEKGGGFDFSNAHVKAYVRELCNYFLEKIEDKNILLEKDNEQNEK